MAYYPATYNRLTDGTPITRGMAVEVIERDVIDYEDVTVLHAGTVERLDNRKSSDGYTVLIRTADGLLSARPDELRKVAGQPVRRHRIEAYYREDHAYCLTCEQRLQPTGRGNGWEHTA